MSRHISLNRGTPTCTEWERIEQTRGRWYTSMKHGPMPMMERLVQGWVAKDSITGATFGGVRYSSIWFSVNRPFPRILQFPGGSLEREHSWSFLELVMKMVGYQIPLSYFAPKNTQAITMTKWLLNILRIGLPINWFQMFDPIVLSLWMMPHITVDTVSRCRWKAGWKRRRRSGFGKKG